MFNQFPDIFNPISTILKKESKKSEDASLRRYKYAQLMYQPKPLNEYETILKNLLLDKLTTRYKFQKQGCLPCRKSQSICKITAIVVLPDEDKTQFNKFYLAYTTQGLFGCSKGITLVIHTTRFVDSDSIYNILTYIQRSSSICVELFQRNEYLIKHHNSEEYEKLVNLDENETDVSLK